MNTVMQSITSIAAAAALGVFVIAPMPALAQTTPAAAAPSAQTTADKKLETMSDAEVRKLDKETGKVTLKHGEIKNLDMPPMTMVFVIKDKALLEKIKAGDKIKFSAAKEGSQYIVTDAVVVK